MGWGDLGNNEGDLSVGRSTIVQPLIINKI